VAKSFVQKLLKQYAETVDIQAKKSGGNQTRKLADDPVFTLIEIIEKNNDATLAELCELLQEKTQVKIGITTMWKLTK
jgi:transposase